MKITYEPKVRLEQEEISLLTTLITTQEGPVAGVIPYIEGLLVKAYLKGQESKAGDKCRF